MTCATAPGKVILFGEHAVVYGRSAIAAPVSHLRATAVIENSNQPEVTLIAPQIQRHRTLKTAPEHDALAQTVRLFQQAANLSFMANVIITVQSEIPIASGMGSGAAITAAVLRALAKHYRKPHLVRPAALSKLIYEIEKIHHGTPSGIDNTVVAYEKPLYFKRQAPQNLIETFEVKRPFTLLIGVTGIQSQTKVVVGDVRQQWQANPHLFEPLFDTCERIANEARHAIEQGNLAQLGQLMNENHTVLQQMTVSCDALDELTAAARQAGALGAKLSGAGRGGNMIALVNEANQTAVSQALYNAGATAVYTTRLSTSTIS